MLLREASATTWDKLAPMHRAYLAKVDRAEPGLRLRERMGRCGALEMLLVCGCGPRWVPQGCGMRWVCPECRARYYGQQRRRLEFGLRRAGGGHFMTVGVPHSGCLASDERALKRAWVRWRAHAQKHYGGSRPYVVVYELTASGDGHTHGHYVYHARGRQPYAEWRRWWGMALPGLQWAGIKQLYGGAEGVAGYLAKYLSKGVVGDALAPERAAEMLASWRGKRVVSASRGYFTGWREAPCRGCGRRKRQGTQWDATCTTTHEDSS